MTTDRSKTLSVRFRELMDSEGVSEEIKERIAREIIRILSEEIDGGTTEENHDAA